MGLAATVASVPGWFGGHAAGRPRWWPFRRGGAAGAVPFPADLLARSISRDPQLLFRLPREQARRLAVAAVSTAAAARGRSTRRGAAPAGAGSAGLDRTLLDAARRFTAADRLWTDKPACDPGPMRPLPDAGRSSRRPVAAPKPAVPRSAAPGPAELALAPGADPDRALAALLVLGSSGLGALPAPLFARLIDRAVRAAAGAGRAGIADADPRPALRVLDAHLGGGGAIPLRRARTADPAERAAAAIRDWRDLSVCAALLGPARGPAWTATRDAEAFAAVWTVSGVFGVLAPREAGCLADDAGRAAALVRRWGAADARRAAAIVLERCADFVR